MRQYTERYHQARRAGARPIFLLFFGTDRGWRCFGKHTPTVEQIGTELDVFEWSARVLSFGDFRQSLSTESDIFLQGLFEEEVSQYGAQLDNADGYFSRIAANEEILNGGVRLYQGYAYPGFVFADFQAQFFGNVETFTFDKLTCSFTAAQALQPVTPEDPEVDSSTIYSLATSGAATTGATESFTYTTLEEAFYTQETWVFVYELIPDVVGESILFAIENAEWGHTRLEIGIDGDDHPYIKFVDDITDASPTYTIVTADFDLTDTDTRLEFGYDAATKNYTISDNHGNVYVFYAGGEDGWEYESQFGTAGTGDGQFDNPKGFHIDVNNNIYVCDTGNSRVEKFDEGGNYLLQLGEFGTGDGQFRFPRGISVDVYGNIFVTDHNNNRVQKFSNIGVYVSQFGSSGTGDGQFAFPKGIAINQSTGAIYVVDSSNDRIQIFTAAGVYSSQFGTTGTGNGQFSGPEEIWINSLGNVYVSDTGNDRIQYFTGSGSYLNQFGTNGTGDGQFDSPIGVYSDAAHIYVVDSNNNRVQIFSLAYAHELSIGTSGSGDGEFSFPSDVYLNSNRDLFISDSGNDRVQRFAFGPVAPTFDQSDNGYDDTITVQEDFDGEGKNVNFNSLFQLVNENVSETEWTDIVGGNDVTIIDGTWEPTTEIEYYIEVIDVETRIDTTTEIVIKTTDQYSYPGANQANVALPLLYGDGRENSDAGVSVCPCIDAINHVYCVAGWPIQSVADGNVVEVWVDGTQVTIGWTFDESNNYESQGEIAILDFTSDPGGVVSVRCNGKWVNGALLTNPIDIIEDFLDYAAQLTGGVVWEKDPTTFAKARNDADLAGYVCAGVIQSNNTVGYWLKSILKSFLGNFRFNADGELEVKLLPLSITRDIQEELLEYEAITVNAERRLSNVCSRVIINYAISYANADKRFKNNATTSYFRTADGSQTSVGSQVWNLDFDWCRNTNNIELMIAVLLSQYGESQNTIKYAGQDFKFVPLDLNDQIQSTLSFVLDGNGIPLEDVAYSIRNKTINLDDFTTSLELQTVNFAVVESNAGNNIQYYGENIQYYGQQIQYEVD